MKPHFPTILAALILMLLPCMAAETRDWTSKDGRKISGVLIAVTGDAVKLKLPGGKTVDVAFKLLTDADVEYAKKAALLLKPDWHGWPSELRMNLSDVKITVDEERSNGAVTYYLTEHFELKSEVELGSQVRLDVGRIFELTYRLNEISPWGIMASPDGGRFKAELYATRAGYIAAGAPTWSGGVYMGGRKVFMVPVESLGLRKSSKGYQRDESYSLDTVVHEITHMLMADAIPYLPIAVTEGVAEYISHIPFTLGAFKPDGILDAIRKDSEKNIPLDFKTLLGMTASQWSGTAPPARGPGNYQPPVDPHSKRGQYRASLLFAYHLMHGLDGGEPDRLQSLIARAHAKAKEREGQIEKYEKEFAIYDAAIKEFLKLPGVEETNDDGFTYPADLTPPEAPEVPFPEETEEQRELGDMEVIYAGKTPADFAEEMGEKLRAQKVATAP